MISRELTPCWYELSWKNEGDFKKYPALVLRIHQDFIKTLPSIPADAPIVNSYRENFELNHFEASLENNFGFDNALRNTGQHGEFTEFDIFIPVVYKLTGRKCPECRGRKKNRYSGGECFYCEGTGKEHIFDWRAGEAIAATIAILFLLLSHHRDKKTSWLAPQLLTVQTMVKRDIHGGSLWGQYSQPLVQWFSAFPPHTRIPEMEKAMQTAYEHIMGKKDYIREYDFRASVDYAGGWLNVSCPGDACGLNPNHGSEYEMKRGIGYEFSCHNVDNLAQQLTLLAGLAALHDRARAETQNARGVEFARQLMPADAKEKLKIITKG